MRHSHRGNPRSGVCLPPPGRGESVGRAGVVGVAAGEVDPVPDYRLTKHHPSPSHPKHWPLSTFPVAPQGWHSSQSSVPIALWNTPWQRLPAWRFPHAWPITRGSRDTLPHLVQTAHGIHLLSVIWDLALSQLLECRFLEESGAVPPRRGESRVARRPRRQPAVGSAGGRS